VPEQENEPGFVEELRRAAEAVVVAGPVPVPVPVEEMIRRGRVLRSRRRLAVTGAGTAGVLAALLAAGLAWLPAGAGSAETGGSDSTAPPAATRKAPFPHGAVSDGPVEVRPYERVVISDEAVLGLLPEGNQNYVVSTPELFDADIEAARQYPGSNIDPRSIGAGYRADAGRIGLIDGVWRLDGTPPRIVIVSEGQDVAHPATVVTLTGQPGWGVYYFDASRHPDFTLDFRVIAYDANGEAIAETQVTGPW
jgi:hypothetical protein